MIIIGLDPGISGSIAFYDLHTELLLNVLDMPTLASDSGKRSVDAVKLSEFVLAGSKVVSLAVVEEVASMPGQGVVSMFSFGKAYGVAIGVLAAHKIPIVYVKPAVWKIALNLTHDKDRSRALAIQMFPNFASEFARKKDDGRAEAALLAKFGSRFHKFV